MPSQLPRVYLYVCVCVWYPERAPRPCSPYRSALQEHPFLTPPCAKISRFLVKLYREASMPGWPRLARPSRPWTLRIDVRAEAGIRDMMCLTVDREAGSRGRPPNRDGGGHAADPEPPWPLSGSDRWARLHSGTDGVVPTAVKTGRLASSQPPLDHPLRSLGCRHPQILSLQPCTRNTTRGGLCCDTCGRL